MPSKTKDWESNVSGVMMAWDSDADDVPRFLMGLSGSGMMSWKSDVDDVPRLLTGLSGTMGLTGTKLTKFLLITPQGDVGWSMLTTSFQNEFSRIESS